jgi:hypothetical protein
MKSFLAYRASYCHYHADLHTRELAEKTSASALSKEIDVVKTL